MQDHYIIQYTPDPQGPSHWLSFSDPIDVLETHVPGEVQTMLRRVDEAVAEGLYAAGYLAYEAATSFDPAYQTHSLNAYPLARFGFYRSCQVHDTPPLAEGAYELSDWTPSLTAAQYAPAIARIRDWIASGDTYQVNYTLRLNARFKGEPRAWFLDLCRAQRPRHAAYVSFGDDVFCSISPELFIDVQGDQIRCRPMKGTSPRGRTWSEDVALANQLQQSDKNRAENVMILDMMRNDLGRIAVPGSVRTERLFDVERYETILQMTSTVSARSSASFSEILKALFPSSSITGAPKVRTMEIILDLEPTPRGIYTGSIGFIAPCHPVTGIQGRHAHFNVAIRTAHLHRPTGHATYGTGGGIVWDSIAEAEYGECRTKALILQRPTPPFRLLETLLWRPRTGYVFLNRHLHRLTESAHLFGFSCDKENVRQELFNAAQAFSGALQRVRLLLNEQGIVAVEHTPTECNAGTHRVRWRIGLNDRPIDASDRFLCNKTTHRKMYDDARTRHPEWDDVILWNEQGELTETTMANLFLKLDGTWYTPPVNSGLLGGVFRSRMIQSGRLKEKTLTHLDLRRAEAILLGNSVRGIIRTQLVMS